MNVGSQAAASELRVGIVKQQRTVQLSRGSRQALGNDGSGGRERKDTAPLGSVRLLPVGP
jgi:hypothetical protein